MFIYLNVLQQLVTANLFLFVCTSIDFNQNHSRLCRKRENVSTNNCSHLKIMRTIFLWMSLQVAVSTLQSISRTVDTQPGQDKKRTFSKLYFLTRGESEDKTQTRAMALLPTVKCEDEDDDGNLTSTYIQMRTYLYGIYLL